ncbi:hypothetical protein FSP39_009709 [Pinctada imbricata]|uniref:FHA domain-containing protein n=1 Tax=Pinctada imbricata TaxID=66713 RepID=A0AA88XUW4_PINIB|nr:hypothetical protein FSP39_009709 [Pinctada imbricata]
MRGKEILMFKGRGQGYNNRVKEILIFKGRGQGYNYRGKEILMFKGRCQGYNDRVKEILMFKGRGQGYNNRVKKYLSSWEHTLVGRPDADSQQDIQLSGLGIQPEHCVVDIDSNDVYLTPLEGARTCVNGSPIHQKTRVKHGDRILWGNNHFFRINCPKLNSPSNAMEPEQPIDYNFAQQEYMMKEYSNDPIQEAIIGLEKQYEEDKQEALEKQKQEYEHQMQVLRNQIMSPGTPSTQYLNFTSPSTPQSTIQRKYQKWAQEREKNFKHSLHHLREEVVRANMLVREANVLAQEMGKKTEFQVTLQIPACNLSPNRRRGAFVSEPAILVKRKNRGSQIWSMEKFENKIIEMRDLYEERKREGLPMMVEDTDPDTDSWDDGPQLKVDPFFESQENHNLIGVANIFLECLFHDVKLVYHVPIISQQGEIAGKLHVEISKLGGTFLDRFADINEEEEEDHLISIKEAKGLPASLSNFVFCQYTFWDHEGEPELVPPEISPESSREGTRSSLSDTLDVRFKYSKVYTTDEFIEHCQDGALSIEVWGHKIQSTGNSVTDYTKTVTAKTKSLADRWSEVKRKIELWTDIQELNHQGQWGPVEVQPKQEVPSAGVFQLQQGHSRKIMVRVKPVVDSGTLPLICDSITSVCVGCIYSRQKILKGFDSYQESDLTSLRERWSEALTKRKEYLHEQLQRLINKSDKSEADCDRERALMEQWVSLTEERNAVMVPSPGSGIPGAPADTETAPNMEMHMPVLFLDLNADDMSTPSAKEGYQAAGMASILPKEHSSTFVNLPITKTFTQKDSICAIASWDSSMHDSVHLNRVTPSSDYVYLILKVTVRLSHPASMELVLRKRICINIYTSLSFTNLAGKLKQKIAGSEKFYHSGVTYDVVSNIPKASEDLENLESLAQMAALQNDTSAEDGETYIEKYIKGVSGVESILTLDRLRQEVAVKELTTKQGTVDTQNHQHTKYTCSVAKAALSPHGNKTPIKPMSTLVEEQHRREEKPLLRRNTEDDFSDDEDCFTEVRAKVESDPISPDSEDFQDFESYQSQQDKSEPQKIITTTGNGIVHSNTNDSLADVPCKNFTPSLVSSGYGSQAVSMLTLSSEDSISLRSVDENSEGSKEYNSKKRSMEQTSGSSSSDSDMDEGKGRGVPNEDVSNSENEDVNSDLNSQNNVKDEEKDVSEKSQKEGEDDAIEEVLNSNSDAGSLKKNVKILSEDQEMKDDSSKDSDTIVPTNLSERMRKSKEERQRILESLGAKSDKSESESHTVVKPKATHGASAIVDHVDQYSETAMEQLECLSIDEEDILEEDGEKSSEKGKVDLFISEESEKSSDKRKVKELKSPTVFA